MTSIKNTAQAVRVQAVGKVTKCRNSGASIVIITATSQRKRKE